jgi:1-phosphofructokinase
MILCVTPNPALDRIFLVPGFARGRVFRAPRALPSAGGKGTNVARALRALGSECRVAGLLGDAGDSQLYAAIVESEGLPHAWTRVPGEVRTSVIVVDPEDGEATVVNEEGLAVSEEDWTRFCRDVGRAAEGAAFVCLCGTLPPGAPAGAAADLASGARRTGAIVWVDTSGESLREALGARPNGVKVNATEAAVLTGGEARTPEQAVAAARWLLSTGCGAAVVTMGEQGAALADTGGAWWAGAPALEASSAVGSGDAFLAGLVGAMAAGASPADALRAGTAAGAANALGIRPGQVDPAEVERLLPLVAVTRADA